MIIITVIVPVAGLLIMISAAIAFRVQAIRAAREEDHWVKDESRLARLAPHRPLDDDFADDDIPEFTPGHRSTATDLDWDSGGFLAAPTIAPSRDEPLSALVDAQVSEPARTARTTRNAGAAGNAGPATRSSQAPQSFGRHGNHVDHARGRADEPADERAEDPDDPWTRLSFSRPTWPASSVPDDDPRHPADAAASPGTARGAQSVGRTSQKGPPGTPSPSGDRHARKLPTVAELVQRIQTERYAPGTAYSADAGEPREGSRPDLVGRSWTHPQIRPQERSEPQPRPHTGGQPRPHTGGQTGPRPRPQPATGSPARPAAQSGPQALPGSGPRLRPPTTTGPQTAPRATGPQGRPPAETGPRSGARPQPQPQPQTGPQTGPQPQPRTEPVRVPDEPPYGSTGAWPTVPGPRLPADNTPPTGRLCRERLSELDSTPGTRSPGRSAEGEPAACPDQPFDRRDTDHADRAGRSDRSGQGGRRGPLVHRHPADGRWRP